MNKIPLFSLLLMLLVSGAVSCKKTETPVVPPDLTIAQSIDVQEGTAEQLKAVIPVTLSKAADKQVSFVWSTTNGTASYDVDYIPVSNSVLVFEPGETTKNIEILIVNDSVYETDKTFFVDLVNIKNANAANSRTKVTIVNDDPFNPTLRLAPLTKVNEGTATAVTAKIAVTINPAPDKNVVLKWSTKDGSAKSGSDYISVTGATLTFAVGETQKNIEVQLVNDDVLEFNDYFYIVVDEYSNATYTVKESKVVITNDDGYSPELASDGYTTPLVYPGMQLVWSDEFDGASLNTNWWSYELGAGGWGNNELQSYTNSANNSFLQNGKLNIVATNSYGNYSSARLITKGKKEFTYGRIDIRAKLPYGQGIWPALWMLGGNIGQVGWPKCGEIDIMEYLGHQVSKVYGTAHYDDNGHQSKGGSYTLSGGKGFDDEFHVFTILWQENSIIWYVDYVQYYEVTNTTIKYAAFDLPQFFIFNIAVGGNWPGSPNGTTVFPQTMTVDYVRVFQPN